MESQIKPPKRPRPVVRIAAYHAVSRNPMDRGRLILGLMQHVTEAADGPNQFGLAVIHFVAEQSHEDLNGVLGYLRTKAPNRFENGLAADGASRIAHQNLK